MLFDPASSSSSNARTFTPAAFATPISPSASDVSTGAPARRSKKPGEGYKRPGEGRRARHWAAYEARWTQNAWKPSRDYSPQNNTAAASSSSNETTTRPATPVATPVSPSAVSISAPDSPVTGSSEGVSKRRSNRRTGKGAVLRRAERVREARMSQQAARPGRMGASASAATEDQQPAQVWLFSDFPSLTETVVENNTLTTPPPAAARASAPSRKSQRNAPARLEAVVDRSGVKECLVLPTRKSKKILDPTPEPPLETVTHPIVGRECLVQDTEETRTMVEDLAMDMDPSASSSSAPAPSRSSTRGGRGHKGKGQGKGKGSRASLDRL